MSESLSTLYARPLELEEQPFLRYLQLLDEGLKSGAVALTADEPYGVWELRIVAPSKLRSVDEDLDELDEVAEALSQLLLFAFNGAPDDVVSEWASSAGSKPEVAVRRVGLVRSTMPVLRGLWAQKTHARFPILTGFTTDTVALNGGETTHGLLRISGNENVHGVFSPGLKEEVVRVAVWPDDVARLIAELTELRESIIAAQRGVEAEGER